MKILATFFSSVVLLHATFPSTTELIRVNRAVEAAARRYDVEAPLLLSIIWVESKFNPDAVGRGGELGLGQLAPITARHLGVADPTNIEQNVDGIARLLSHLLNKYGGNKRLAVAAYNTGEGTVDRCARCVPNPGYVNRVYGDLYPFARRVFDYVQTVLVPAQGQQLLVEQLQQRIQTLEQEQRQPIDPSRYRQLEQALARVRSELQTALQKQYALQQERDRLQSELSTENQAKLHVIAELRQLRLEIDLLKEKQTSLEARQPRLNPLPRATVGTPPPEIQIPGDSANHDRPFAFSLKAGAPLSHLFQAGSVSTGQYWAAYSAPIRRYPLGIGVDLRFSPTLAVAVEALYKRIHYRAAGGQTLGVTSSGFSSTTTGNSFEFPLLLKYRFSSGEATRPFLITGPVARYVTKVRQRQQQWFTGNPPLQVLLTNPLGLHKRLYPGLALGAGVELRAPGGRLTPEFRYTRWLSDHFRPGVDGLRFTANQAEFLLGLMF